MNPAEQIALGTARAATAIRTADAVLIGAGAGLGVDSGLPDFRGREGFWRAYPAFQGRAFEEISTPHWFDDHPEMAWGFFGHRLKLYRETTPHRGFRFLLQLLNSRRLPGFVFTSNVDGQFQLAGFAPQQILEQHGSIHFLQCHAGCSDQILPADEVHPQVDLQNVRLESPLPRCAECQSIMRPNILMFGDFNWNPARWQEQQVRYREWRKQVSGANIVAIELGAGTAIPTVRFECEHVADTVIRINPRDHQVPAHGISIPCGALQALTLLEQELETS